MSIGASVLGLSTASSLVRGDSSSTKKSSFDETYDQALKILEDTGNQAEFRSYLSENTGNVRTEDNSFTPTHSQDGQDLSVSPNEWQSNAISTNLTMTYNYDHCTSGDPYAYVNLSVTIDVDKGWGEGGPDQTTISWNDSHYRYEEGTDYLTTDMDNVSFRKNDESINGLAWEWEDGKSCWSSTCGDYKHFHVGCKAQLLETNQERAMQAAYWDVYDDAEVSGISFSSGGGASLSISSKEKRDKYGFTIAEGSDASNGCQ